MKRRTVVVIAAAAVLLAAGNPFPGRAADEQVSSRYAKLDNLRVHYEVAGNGGPALVFVHGWSCNTDFWRQQIPDFVKTNRVIAVDLPGHGKSDAPKIAYSMDLFARAIDAVLQHASAGPAVLVGHSMGTPVIRQFYRLFPNRTLALVIVDGSLTPFPDPERPRKLLESLRGDNYHASAAKFVDPMLQPVRSEKLRREIREAMLRTPQHVGVGAMDAMVDPAIWKDDVISVPVLAMMAKSPYWQADVEQAYRKIAPRLEFHMWEGVSHFLMMEEPERFNKELLEFLRRHRLLQTP
jgi:pimeloyl-ACP methyl ester carboxylesterase